MSKKNEKLVEAALNLDPIELWEKKTGKNYKENTDEDNCDMLKTAIVANETRRYILDADGDSYYGMPIVAYELLIGSLGFRKVYDKKFQYENYKFSDNNRIWVNNDLGIVLHYDTYRGETVNGGNFYYNWRPNVKDYYKYTSSGSFRGPVWVGYHDCREGIKFNINRLIKNGDLVTPWVYTPFLWFVTYADIKADYDYKEINKTIIASAPELQAIIGNTYDEEYK